MVEELFFIGDPLTRNHSLKHIFYIIQKQIEFSNQFDRNKFPLNRPTSDTSKLT